MSVILLFNICKNCNSSPMIKINKYVSGWEPWSSGYHVPKVVGSNPSAVYWMDMTFFHIDLL